MCVSVGREHLEDAVVDGKERDVKGPPPEVIDEDVLLFARFVHAVRDGSRRGFVDDALYRHAADCPCVLGGLALRVVEVRWDGDDRILDVFAQERLGRAPHLSQNHR
mmetsp:Transcript_36989/g.50041  ORF Transcript_36989/g.50041 Transcript_36989/m.50041 type:complete len:107 (-) Transcript_36989:65-385(-)